MGQRRSMTLPAIVSHGYATDGVAPIPVRSLAGLISFPHASCVRGAGRPLRASLLARPWGFTSLPKHRERLCGLRREDDGEAIADFQTGIGGRDDRIAVPVHGDKHTP